MKTAQLYATRDVRIEEVADTDPGPGELLLDVTAVGICGSDLHTYLNWQVGDTRPASAIILGHEAAGRVRALGPGVTGFQIGQRVAIDPAIACHECERCLAGDENLCLRIKFMGLWPDNGALRERMTHPARACIPLPDNLSDVDGALLEPLGVAIHAIRLAHPAIGDDVLIVGCGAIGLLLIRLARLAGAKRIFVSDEHAWRLDMAKVYGADVLVNAKEADVAKTVQLATGGRGVDVAIESAWATETVNQCIDAARNGGRVVIVGIPAEDLITLRASAARRKGLTIKLSRRMKHVYTAAINLVSSGQVMLDPLATHRFPLAKTGEALEMAATYADEAIRVMVLPNQA